MALGGMLKSKLMLISAEASVWGRESLAIRRLVWTQSSPFRGITICKRDWQNLFLENWQFSFVFPIININITKTNINWWAILGNQFQKLECENAVKSARWPIGRILNSKDIRQKDQIFSLMVQNYEIRLSFNKMSA